MLSAPARPDAHGRATDVDGVWTMDTDRSAAVPEYFDENWGHWVFVFDHGRFAITQENETSCTWGYGTYAVNGSPHRVDIPGRRRHRPQRRDQPARRVLRLRRQYVPRHTDPHTRQGRDRATQLPGSTLASDWHHGVDKTVQQALPSTRGCADPLTPPSVIGGAESGWLSLP